VPEKQPPSSRRGVMAELWPPPMRGLGRVGKTYPTTMHAAEKIVRQRRRMTSMPMVKS